MAIFEGDRVCLQPGRARHRSSRWSRGMIGFVIAIALMLVIPYLAGLPLVRLF